MTDQDYQRMWREHPQGTLYPADLPLPWLTVPHEFTFVGEASTEYEVTVNDGVAVASTFTDGDGGGRFGVVLGVGRARIKVYEKRTGRKAYGFNASVLPQALFLHLHAREFSGIRDDVARLRSALSIATADGPFLSAVYGERLRYANRLGADLQTYREQLRAVRQTNKHLSTTTEGLAAISAITTGSRHFDLPQKWQPGWFLGDHLLEGEFRRRSLTTGGLAADFDTIGDLASSNLNVVTRTWVLGFFGTAGFPGNDVRTIAPGPYTALPNNAARLEVVFESGWDGGDVSVVGTSSSGAAVTETFSPPATIPATGVSVRGTYEFASIAQVTKSATGISAAAVHVGLRDHRFVRASAIGYLNAPTINPGISPAGTTIDLAYDQSLNAFSWNSALYNGNDPETASTGELYVGGTLGLVPQIRSTIGIAAAGTYSLAASDSSIVSYDYANRLWVALDNLGLVQVRLETGNPTPTVAEVVTDINTWVNRWPQMGGTREHVDVAITGTPADGETFQIIDYAGRTTTFEWDPANDGVGAGNVDIDNSGLTGGQEALESAIALVAAVSRSQSAAYAVISDVTDPANDVTVTLYQGFVGTAGSATSPSGSTNWTISANFSSGVLPTERGTGASKETAQSVTAFSDGSGATALNVRSRSEDGSGFSSRVVGIYPGGLDAESVVLGSKTARTIVVTAAAGSQTITCADSSVFPSGGPEILQPWQSGAQTIRTYEHGTALEVWFSPDYDGPSTVELIGVDCFGNALREEVVWPGARILDSGNNLSIDGTGNVVTFVGSAPIDLRQELGVRHTSSDEVSLVRFVSGAVAVVDASFSATSTTNQNWELLDVAVVSSANVFDSVTSISISGSITTGQIAVYRSGTFAGEQIKLRIGRNSVIAEGNSSVAVTSSGGGYTATITGLSATQSSGWLVMDGWDAASPDQGANDGLHTVLTFDPTGSSNTVSLIHEFHDAGKALTAATNTVDWALISRGEVRSIGYNDTGSNVVSLLSFLGTSEEYPESTGPSGTANVELEAELSAAAIGPARGLDTITIEVDADYAPSTDQTDAVPLYGERLPDSWTWENIDVSNSGNTGFADYPGMSGVPLNLDVSSASDAFVEFRSPRLLDFAGLAMTLTIWISNHSGGSRDFSARISFDGGATFSTEVSPSVTISTTPFGSANPSRVDLSFVSPAEIDYDPIVQIQRDTAGAAITDEWAIHDLILTVDAHEQIYLGLGTTPKGPNDLGQSIVWVTGHEPADLATRSLLGLPATPGQALDGPGLDAELSERGHIDYLGVLHARHYRANLTEDSLMVGSYLLTDWLTTTTLTNMEVVAGAPDQLSRIVPEQITQVTGEELTITSPPDATVSRVPLATALNLAAQKSSTMLPAPGLRVPERAEGDRLYQSGNVLPNTQVGDRAQVTIGGSGATGNDEVYLTWQDTGTGPNALAVTVVNPGARSPLVVTQDETGDFTLTLAHDGTSLVPGENAARNVAQKFEDLGTVEVSYAGTGLDPLIAGDAGSFGFAGGDPNPWRWTATDTLQIAAVIVGDDPSFDEYGGGGDAYEVDYLQLTRAETEVLDLSASYTDYIWIADLAMYRRLGHDRFDDRQYERLNFLSDRTAQTSFEAKVTDSSNTLYVDDGVNGVQEVPKRFWQFLEPRFVQVDGGAYSANSVYWLDYTAVRMHRRPVVQFLLEIRSASTPGAVTSSEWRAIQPDDLIDASSNRYHQLRASFWNIETLDDLVVYGLGLRGVRIAGSSAVAPGLIPC